MLDVDHEPQAHDAGDADHAAVTSWMYASSSVGSRDETRPTAVPFSCERIACVSSRPGAVWTIRSCCLLVLLDDCRADAVERQHPLDGELVDPEDLHLDDAAGLDSGLELLRRALRDDLAVRDHGDPVAERVGLEHVVGRQQHGLARLGQRGDQRAQLACADRIDPDRRLVEEEHRRVVQEAARDVQPLPHPAAVALDPLLLAALQADEVEQLVDAGPLAAGLDGVELGEVAQVVETREPLVEAALAPEHVADPLADPARVLDDVPAEHARAARRRDQQRDQHLDRRRLAGAVRAEQAEELALADREADPSDRLDVVRPAPDCARRDPVGAVEIDRLDDVHGPSLRDSRDIRQAEAGLC